MKFTQLKQASDAELKCMDEFAEALRLVTHTRAAEAKQDKKNAVPAKTLPVEMINKLN